MKKNLKIILSILVIILICIAIYLVSILINRYNNKKNLENDILTNEIQTSKTIFAIDKIVFFSNCSAKSKIASNSNIIIENLYQYTDIAIYINNDLENEGIFTNENTLKNVYIDNIEFTEKPSVGTTSLYYKNINSFTKDEFLDENLITDNLTFETTSSNEADFSTPVLYNNCANPITISYLNNNIKTDFGIDNSSSITYDGSLLNECFVTLASLNCAIAFDIHIINNLDEEFICNVSFSIPLSSENKNLNDGTLTVEQDTNLSFEKVKKNK